MPQGGTYNFLQFACAYSGPFGYQILSGGVADEGITVAYEEDFGGLVGGAGGDWMHSGYASRRGKVTVRLLKTSPQNGWLSRLANFESVAANRGRGTITGRNPYTGDTLTAQGAAVQKIPDNANGKDGGMMEWVFLCGYIDEHLGDGDPVIVTA